ATVVPIAVAAATLMTASLVGAGALVTDSLVGPVALVADSLVDLRTVVSDSLVFAGPLITDSLVGSRVIALAPELVGSTLAPRPLLCALTLAMTTPAPARSRIKHGSQRGSQRGRAERARMACLAAADEDG